MTLDGSRDRRDETRSLREENFWDDDIDFPVENQELTDIFDQYSAALDAGDQEKADQVLAAHPGIGDEFMTPLRGLYLLGREARQLKEESKQIRSVVKRLGDFELGEELGRGGMGIVYAAKQISLQRDVALKILPFTAVLDPRQVSRFQNEAQAAASLHHPNIVPVYGVGCERGVHYYSMQLIKGQTFAQLVRQLRDSKKDAESFDSQQDDTRISTLNTVASIHSRSYVRNIVNVGVKIARAIHYAHEHGIIHRDIKPSNLLLDQGGTPWVADFGLARGRGSANLTSQGDQVGTLRYMSPEQAAGRNHQVDFRTDVYSLGVTMYELLTLRPVFEENDRIKLLEKIQSDEPPSMRLANSSIPYDLETIINKAIAKNPQQRYDSAEEMAADLNRFFDGKTILARRKSLFERVADSVAKNKRLAATVATLMLLTTMAAIAVASVFYQQQRRERAAAAEARYFLQQAHQTVDRFNLLLSDQVLTVPGSEPLRNEMVSESIGYYKDFLGYTRDNVGFEFEQAQAHAQLAELHERTGNDVEARIEYETSIKAFASLERADANFEEADGLNRLGLLLYRNGDLKNGLSLVESSIDKIEDLDGDDALVLHATALANAAKFELATGDADSSIRRYESALDLLPDDSSEMEVLVARAKITNGYAVLLGQSDLQRGIEVLVRSIETIEKSQKKIRGNKAATRVLEVNAKHLADMRNNIAIFYSRTGEFEDAESHAKLAIELWNRQLKQHPSDDEAMQGLATVLNTVGEVRLKSQSAAAGSKFFAKAEPLLRRANRLRSQPETKSRLAGVLHNRSLVAFSSGGSNTSDGPNVALTRIREAIRLQSEAVKAVPENETYRSMLASHREALVLISNRIDSPVSSRSKDIQ